MSATLIDLNADVGERPGADGIRLDEQLLHGVSSANVACGFHAGDGATMQAVCERAVSLRKRIGAHVSYLDREGFGRRDLEVPPDRLAEHVVQQIRALQVAAGVSAGSVTYVKPHGALYNRAQRDPVTAEAVAGAVASVDRGLKLLGLPDSELLVAARRHGLAAVAEGFADRAYLADGRLAPRGDGAVLGVEAAVLQARSLAIEGQATAIDGTLLSLSVRSLCIHSDTPGATELAVRVRNALIGAGCEIRPFA